MSAAVDTSLDWVTFTDEEHGEPCMAHEVACTNQATHVAFFLRVEGDCEEHGRKTYCLAHAEELLENEKRTGRFRCTCEPPSRWLLDALEPLS